MKKIILIPLLLATFLAAHSQQDSVLKSKKGKVILPEKHDFAIGISGNSLFNYLGNFFSQAGNNNLNLSLIGGNSLYAKFFLNKHNAIRMRTYVSLANINIENELPSDLDPSGIFLTKDRQEGKTTNYSFALGYERRHGSGRLQIIGGAELTLNRSYSNYTYSYGNAFTNSNTSPNTTIGFNSNATNTYTRTNSRILNSINDSGIGYGARAYFGLEYFIFPKISLGGEFGFSVNKYFNALYTNSNEHWDYLNKKTVKQDLQSKNNRASTLTDNLNGQILVIFYFH